MRIDYGAGDAEAVLGVYTLVVYEQEFRSDLIQDLFGRAVLRKEADEEDVIFAVDYRDVNWTSLAKVLWAALKAADDSVPSFKAWAAGAGAIDLNAVHRALVPEAMRMFFRAGAGDSE